MDDGSSEEWAFACGHCEKALPPQSERYVSPVCANCAFHIHEECRDLCPERLDWSADDDDSGWAFACGHCQEALTKQSPGQESPTCSHCHFHIHARCIASCPEDAEFDELVIEHKIVRSANDLASRERRSLDSLYDRTASTLNKDYRKLLDALHCIYVEDFGFCRLSAKDGFAWLNPYTGNQHNRCCFVQLALAVLWRNSGGATFNGRFIEAFLGSGQIFLNFSWCMPLFGTDQPRVIAGDLNVCLCSAWMGLTGQLHDQKTFLTSYLNKAVRLDRRLAAEKKKFYDGLKGRLNALLAIPGQRSEGARIEIGHLYVYLNNRCANQTTYNLGTGTFSASLDLKKCERLDEIRKNEWNALCRAARFAEAASLEFAEADFTDTTAPAGLGDLVVYDCPFPEFRLAMKHAQLEELNGILSQATPQGWPIDTAGALRLCRKEEEDQMKGGNRYGSNDGGGLQLRILCDAVAKYENGATIVLCNYAVPSLLVWYSRLSWALFNEVLPIFIFKRPETGDELYLLAIWPSKRVITQSGYRNAGTYLRKQVHGVYEMIRKLISQKSSVSEQEVKAIAEREWGGMALYF